MSPNTFTHSASQTTLPPWLRDALASPPPAGAGVHAWLFNMARKFPADMPAEIIIALLESAVANCGRPVSRREIVDAVQNSRPYAWKPRGSAGPVQAASRWPAPNEEQVEAVIRDHGGLADLWEASNPRLEDGEHAEAIIDKLFPGNPLLCCAKSSMDFSTRPREAWRGELSAMQLIVPSPMSAVTGLTKDGKPSQHTLSNTGPRRFLICEFDTGTPDEQAGVLLHLAANGPLVCAVHSGSKSLHGWFSCIGHSDEKISKFFRYAVSLGADHVTWTRSQFVRMPDGMRDNGNRQTVYYLNFGLMEARP